MPAFTAETPSKSAKFADVAVSIPQPFAEGHALTALEAVFLNRAVGSAVGNAFGARVRKATAAGVPTPDASTFATMYAEYELGGDNRSSGEPTDPTHEAARRIATEPFNALLKSKKIKVNDLKAVKLPEGGTKYDALRDQFIARNPWITSLAEQQVKAMEANADELLEDLDLGGETGEDTTSAEAAE